MENSKIANIKKVSGITAKVLNVIKVVLIVGLVMCIVGGISVMCIRSKDGNSIEIFGKTVTVHSGVELGNMQIEGFGFLEAFDIEDPFVKAGLNCFCAAVLCALALVAVIIIRSAFTEIEKSDTPFKAEIMQKIKIAGILVTIITLADSVGTAAIVGLTFWCVYCIFDYGMELQKSADETL
ncbi:MAG: hypothetical protein K6G81_13230 [Lachnospiraceae bacterium]|nr:hypothetical protein [Lachnospiraceae bacterium]